MTPSPSSAGKLFWGGVGCFLLAVPIYAIIWDWMPGNVYFYFLGLIPILPFLIAAAYLIRRSRYPLGKFIDENPGLFLSILFAICVYGFISWSIFTSELPLLSYLGSGNPFLTEKAYRVGM